MWKGAVLGAATGVVVSFVWSYRRDDTVDMALGRAGRMGAAMGGTGALVGLAVDRRRRRRRRAPAPRRSPALIGGLPATPALEQAIEALSQAADVARPRVEQAVEQAVEAARPRVEQVLEAARPRVEQAVGHAVEAARPRVEQAVEVARPHVQHAVETARPRVVHAVARAGSVRRVRRLSRVPIPRMAASG